MLYRFGWKYNLSFAAFKPSHPYPAADVTKYLLRHPRAARGAADSRWDIMNRHSVFNQSNALKFLHNDTVFIATLRHPLEHLKSTFNHYKLGKHLGMPNDSVELFLENPSKHERLLPASLYNRIAKEQHVYISFTKSRMAFEFGFDLSRAEVDSKYVSDYLEYLNNTFLQVIITDLYDESLIILREKLSWTYKVYYIHGHAE